MFDDKRVPFEYMCPMTETDAVFADRIERSQRAGKNLFFKEWRRIRNIPGIDYI